MGDAQRSDFHPEVTMTLMIEDVTEAEAREFVQRLEGEDIAVRLSDGIDYVAVPQNVKSVWP